MFEDDQKKLRVPEPGEPEHDTDERGGELVVAAAVSLLLGLSFFLYQFERAGTSATSAGGHAHRSADDEPSQLKRRAERLRMLWQEEEKGLAKYPWESRDVLAAFRHGPRGVAERACRVMFREEGETLRTREVWTELLSQTDRLAVYAPWACLYRIFFTDPGRLDGELARGLDQLWDRIFSFDAPGPLVSSIIRRFHADGFVPDDAPFRRWLRLCALSFDTHEGSACRELLAEVAPDQGADLLDVVEVHLRRTELNPSYDVPTLLGGLERLAAEGQPPGWRIAETEALPDYDADLRIGAMFYLCRFVNSPDQQVAQHASRALSRAADYGVRPGDATRRRRWLKACRMAFGTRTDERWKAPALAVWTGDPDDPPRYALKHAIERGDCEVREGHPRWYCGSAKWNATSADALTEFYVKTSGMEWEEAGPLELE